MKKLIMVLSFFLFISFAYADDVSKNWMFKTAESSSSVSLLYKGTYNHRLTWTGIGTRTTCTIKVEQSIDNTTFSDLIAAQDCTTDGAATTTGYANYIRLTITALTGSGNVVYATYLGTPVAPALGAVTVDTTGLATSTLQTSGGQKTQIVTSGGVTVDTFGGGTQYASGALKGTETGTIASWSDGTNIWPASTAKPLPISLPSATVTTLTPPAAITGFATAAKQPALGTAGTASADVITVQGIASMTPILVNPGTADGADGAAPTNPPVPVTGRARASEVAAVDAGDSLTATESLVGGVLVHPEALPQDRWQASSAGTLVDDDPLVSVIAHTDDYFTCIDGGDITNKDADTAGLVQIVQGTGTLCGTNQAVLDDTWVAVGGGGKIITRKFCTTAASTDICIKGFASDGIYWNLSGFKTKLDRVSN